MARLTCDIIQNVKNAKGLNKLAKMSIKIQNNLQKNQKYVVDIVDYGANGEGVAKIDGVVAFVPFAIVGEKLEIQLVLVKKQFVIGKILQILEPSANRINPPCKYFGKCGGCQLQHMNYYEQLKLKTDMVKNAIEKYAKLDCEINGCAPSPNQYGYRNKFAFPLFEKDGKICAGMYRIASHNIVEIDDCLLQEDCKFVLNEFLKFANEQKYDVHDGQSKNGLKHLVVRSNNDNILVCVVSSKKLHNLQKFGAILQQKYKKVHIINNVNNLNNNVILGKKDQIVCGSGELDYEEFGIKYQVNAHSFLQVNTEVKKLLYNAVLNSINKNDVVIDAYSGAGVLSAIIAKNCKQVYGVEIIKEAVKNADELKNNNKIDNLTNICGDCKDIVPDLIKKCGANVVVLDPPRKGCDQKVIEALLDSEPAKIVYVSCNPATLARDLNLLSNKYVQEKITPYDMFPQTANVETLVVLKKK